MAYPFSLTRQRMPQGPTLPIGLARAQAYVAPRRARSVVLPLLLLASMWQVARHGEFATGLASETRSEYLEDTREARVKEVLSPKDKHEFAKFEAKQSDESEESDQAEQEAVAERSQRPRSRAQEEEEVARRDPEREPEGAFGIRERQLDFPGPSVSEARPASPQPLLRIRTPQEQPEEPEWRERRERPEQPEQTEQAEQAEPDDQVAVREPPQQVERDSPPPREEIRVTTRSPSLRVEESAPRERTMEPVRQPVEQRRESDQNYEPSSVSRVAEEVESDARHSASDRPRSSEQEVKEEEEDEFEEEESEYRGKPIPQREASKTETGKASAAEEKRSRKEVQAKEEEEERVQAPEEPPRRPQKKAERYNPLWRANTLLPLHLRVVVFDLAGTTLEDAVGEPLAVTAIRHAFRRAGIEVESTTVTGFRGLEKHDAIRQILRHVGREEVGEKFVSDLYRFFKEALDDLLASSRLREVPGTTAAFQALQARGIRVVIGSGFNLDVVRLVVRRLGWHVDGVVAANRPRPDAILEAMEMFDVSNPRKVLKVGDTVADIQEGHAAGAWTAAVLTGTQGEADLRNARPDYMLTSVAQIPSLLPDPGLIN